MEKTTVYDLPTRFFHWLFAALFISAFAIAKTSDDDNPIFSYHMLAGITMLFILALRLLWGIFGTTYAKFSSFRLHPVELFSYFKDVLFSRTKKYFSHNPASSAAAVLMFSLTLGLGFSGIIMASGNESEFYEEAHEIMANLFIITVAAHLAGLLLHHMVHNDSLWSSMFNGKKDPIQHKTGINSSRPVMGFIFLLLSLSWIGYVYSNYDTNTRTLALFGNQLQLGEYEGAEHESETEYKNEQDDEDDDD